MPGPALNSIANTAPVAPAKAATGSRPDAPDTAGGTSAPEQGFASELKRQMQGDATPEQGADAKAAEARAASDDSADPADGSADPAAPLPPELAAMLAASAGAAQMPAAPRPDPVRGDAATSEGAAKDGKPAGTTAALTGEAANLAARASPLAADTARPPITASAEATKALATEGTGSRGAESGADASATAPTNNFAAIHAAALANLRGGSAQAPAAPVPLHVATPAGSPGWSEEVGNRVSWMVGHAESHAELTLTPPQLGKVEVSITVAGDQTSAQIVAATPAARDLIEQSLPRLREILEQSGINLGQTDVGTSGQPGNSGDGRRSGTWRTGGGGAQEPNVTGAAGGGWLRRAEGLVDTFA